MAGIVSEVMDDLLPSVEEDAVANTDAGSSTSAATDTATATATATATTTATAAAAPIIPRDAIAKTAIIIFAMFAAKLIFYAVDTNIEMFSTEFLYMDAAEVHESSLIVQGIDCVLLLLAGWFADSFSGYYFAAQVGSIISLIGICIMPLISFDWSQFGPSYGLPIYQRRIYFLAARIIINAGIAPTIVVVPPYAARQVEACGVVSIQSCFHYLYTIILFAPLIAYTTLSFIQLNVSFFVSYLIAIIIKLAWMAFFYYAYDYYAHHKPDGGKSSALVAKAVGKAIVNKTKNGVTSAYSVFQQICANCNCNALCNTIPEAVETTGETVELLEQTTQTATTQATSVGIPMPTTADTTTGEGSPTTSDAGVDGGEAATENPSSSGDGANSYGTITAAETSTTTAPSAASESIWLEDKTASIIRSICLLSGVLPYGILRYQLTTSYLQQAERLTPNLLGTAVSTSVMTTYLPVVGIVLTPFINVYIYPLMCDYLFNVTFVARFLWGLVFAILSVLSAAVVEAARLTIIERGGSFSQEVDGVTLVASDLTITYLIPQYVFMAVADILIFVTGLEFAFTQSPYTLQATVTGLFYFYGNLGELVGALLVPLINTITAGNEWYPPEINDGHLDYYFLVLAAINVINMGTLWMMSYGYEAMEDCMCPPEQELAPPPRPARKKQGVTQQSSTGVVSVTTRA